MRGWRFHRVAIFIPYMLPVAVVGVLFGQLLTLHGALNTSLQTIGLGVLHRTGWAVPTGRCARWPG